MFNLVLEIMRVTDLRCVDVLSECNDWFLRLLSSSFLFNSVKAATILRYNFS